MPFPYKNPTSPIQVLGTQSVDRSVVFGTHFSTNGTGGFMEVFSLSGLTYEIPAGQTGSIEYSGNTIPINFVKGTGAVYSPDVLILNSDNISSGRRKLGMLAYVYELDQVYQYDIPNYEQLWTAATASTNCVFINEFGTTVRNNTTEGRAFINAWTASTIEGVNGVVRSNARWKKYWGNNLSVTGGSYNGVTNTLTLVNITGGTVSIPGFGGGGGGGASFTGGTFTQSSLEINLTSTAGTLTISGVTGLYISGGSYSSGNTTLSLSNSTGGTITITGFSQTFSGGSGNCINQLYLNEIYPCTSDIKIQPLSAGKVYFGSSNGASGFTVDLVTDTSYKSTRLGLNTNSPDYTFDFYARDRKNRFYFRDNLTGGFLDIKNIIFSGESDLNSSFSVISSDASGQQGAHGIGIGLLGYNTASSILNNGAGKPGDTFIQVFADTNGLNIINGPGSVGVNTEDYIRFYAGQIVNDNIPDLHIQGSGTTRGYIGINVTGVTNQLHVSAATNPVRFEGLQQSALTRYLVADTNGVVYFTTGVTSGSSSSSGFTTISITGTPQFTSIDSQTINFSGINITITSAATNTLVFSAGTSTVVSGDYLPLSGGTVSGNTIFQSGVTAATISATTYLGLPYSGTTDYVVKWKNSTGLTDSLIYDNGSIVVVSGTSATVSGSKFSVTGPIAAQGVQLSSKSGSIALVTSNYASWGTGGSQIAIGDGGPLGSSTGTNNIAIGSVSIKNAVTPSGNTAIGTETLNVLTGGNYNVAIGYGAAKSINDTDEAVYIGYQAGMNGGSVGNNVVIGSQAATLLSGANNVVIGKLAFGSKLTGAGNVAIGVGAGRESTGGGSVFIGYQAGYYSTGDNKLYIHNSLGNPPLIYGEFDNLRLGIGTTAVTNTLHVSAATNPVRFQGLQQSALTRYLVADVNGVVYFTTGVTSGSSSSSSGFTTISITGTPQFTSTDSQTINFSGINISITSGVSNTLVFSAGTGGGISISGDYLPLSGGTVSGNTIFQSGLTATTISATTYYNLPPFSGGSGSCVNQLYLNELYPCTSDIKIQPSSDGNVFFGSLSGASGFTVDLVSDTVYETARLGLNNTLPEHTIDFYSRDRKNRLYLSDNLTNLYNFSNNYTIGDLAQFVISDIYDDVVLSWTGTSITLYNSSGDSVTKTLNNVFFNSPAGLGLTRLNFSGLWAEDYSEAAGGFFVRELSIGDGQNGAKSLIFSGDSDTRSSLTVSGPSRFGTNGSAGISMGLRGYTTSGTVLNNQVGVTGDSFIRVFTATNGLNIINEVGTNTDNYIRFYAGQNFIDNVPDIHIQGSGTTRGFVGINITGVTNQLHISATTNPIRLEGLQQSALTRYLVADTNGVVYFTTAGTSGEYLPLSGGTVSGNTIFQSGLTATTISATTYSNLPTDIRTTGGTYSNNTFTFTNNTGGTYSVFFNTVTGLTINGDLTVTGNTSLKGLTATTISATTYQGLPLFLSGGSYNTGTTTLSLFNSTGGTFYLSGFAQTFSGGSGSCINQLYLNEIYPCADDIKIQPSSDGNVFFGSLSGASGFTVDLVSDTVYETARLGLNTTLPEHTIDFYSRDRKNRLYLSDNLTNVYNVTNDPDFVDIGRPAKIIINQTYDDIVPSWVGDSITIYNSSGDSVTKTLVSYNFNSPAGFTRLNFSGLWAEDYSEAAGGFFVRELSIGDGQNGAKSLIFSGDSDTNSSYTVSGPNRFGANGFHGISMGIRGYTTSGTVLNNQVGVTGDSFIQAFAGTNGLNIINEVGTGTDDYIRFYAGQNFINNVPDIHIQGSGTTKGYVGINITGVTNTLHVSAATHPVRLEGLVSSANTRYLVANSDGVVTYTTSSPGGGGTGFSAITINNTSQFNSSSSQVLNFSGINLTITSAATNTLVFSAGTGGGGGVTSITAGYGVSANTSTGNVTIIQVFDYGKAYTTGNNLNFL